MEQGTLNQSGLVVLAGKSGVPAARRLTLVDFTPHDLDQDGVVPRLLDEAAGAATHGFNGRLDAAPPGHHDHRQGMVMRPHLVEQVETFAPGCRVARVVEVHQQEVVRLPRHAIDDVVDRAHKVGLEARVAEEQAQRLQDVCLVVGDKDARKGA